MMRHVTDNGGSASDPELLSSSDSEVDESDSLQMVNFIEHSYEVLFVPGAEVECITTFEVHFSSRSPDNYCTVPDNRDLLRESER